MRDGRGGHGDPTLTRAREELGDPRVSPLARQLSGCLSRVGSPGAIRAVLEQETHHLFAPLSGRGVQWGEPSLLPALDVGAASKKVPNDLDVSAGNRGVQRRDARSVARRLVGIRAVLEKEAGGIAGCAKKEANPSGVKPSGANAFARAGSSARRARSRSVAPVALASKTSSRAPRSTSIAATSGLWL